MKSTIGENLDTMTEDDNLKDEIPSIILEKSARYEITRQQNDTQMLSF